MRRRRFIKDLQLGGMSLYAIPTIALGCSFKENKFEGVKMIPVSPSGVGPVSLIEGKRVAFGWSALQLDPGSEMTLKPSEDLPEANILLRFTPALEIWDIKLLHIYLAETNTLLGTLDIRYSSVLVPYEIAIDKADIPAINKGGLTIKLASETPFGFFNQSGNKKKPMVFTPHFLASSKEKGSLNDFLDCFTSMKSVQAFGWREGTVLDGLWQLYAKKNNEQSLKAIHDHFDLFFDQVGNIHYESARNDLRDNRIDGIESTIPYATLARIKPDHSILKTAVEGLEDETMENGMITGGSTLTAEGCYTVAYPLAVIGKVWNDTQLMENALAQLRHRFVLINDGNLYLRYNSSNGQYTYKNWARGAAWTLLGFARTIVELKEDFQDDEIIDKFKKGVDIAISMQQENGLWNGFMDSGNAPDTSGSAGISAAILVGINNKILPESYRMYAEKCWNALPDYLTPDGFLKSVSQDNRGGTALQESDYRVIAQMGMGMMAQLYSEM
jgi:rhamnogalacturonyl hydrolase YesR